MVKNNNMNNNFNNNVTEAFSSFGKNNNSTISNAMNNDATIDSKNSIMNIDLKYQKKIDDLERDILNNKSKNENIVNINLNLNDPYYKSKPENKINNSNNNINNNLENKDDIKFTHQINANINNMEMEEYSFNRENDNSRKEATNINNNMKKEEISVNNNINKNDINMNMYKNKMISNNINTSNNNVNYQYDSHNNNNFSPMNHNINDKMVNDIIARNNLLIKQLTNEEEGNNKEQNIIQENINENDELNENNENNNLNVSEGMNDDSAFGENQLSQMSNMTEGTKLLFKKTMDEYPNVEEDTFFNSIQSKN